MTADLGLQVDCQDLVELLTDYLDGELGHSTRLVVEAHVALCDGCDTYLEQLRTIVAGLRHLPARGVDPCVRTTLLEARRT